MTGDILLDFPVYQTPIILASGSPRRIELMKQAGFRFSVKTAANVDESYPPGLKREQIPVYLAKVKADAFLDTYGVDDMTVVITADTIVWMNDCVLGKPVSREEAIGMLSALSGNKHHVYTGVCLTSRKKQQSFFSESKVFFRKLDMNEISYYVDHYQPYDKAGAYGIQEWIGYVGIEKIEGSYFNIVGLPIQKLYCELCSFIA
ncbi:MAG: Maf family nucleotide pyrophosphatase [Bacteroidales bacterium]|jgi:septum formation protein|nr:Maf family nucleotide pyrophosphatase [Bacteroidales bacterium]